MKRIATTILLATIAHAGIARAEDQGHNGDEAAQIRCRVLDASGKELPLLGFEETGTNGRVLLTGSGANFQFQVELANAVAKLSLTDTMSGDKVQVEEGDLDLHETVKVTLVTDEHPDAALSLECKGV